MKLACALFSSRIFHELDEIDNIGIRDFPTW